MELDKRRGWQRSTRRRDCASGGGWLGGCSEPDDAENRQQDERAASPEDQYLPVNCGMTVIVSPHPR